MKLYSEQSHDLRLARERRDRRLGTYADIPLIACAQTRLYDEILGTDQLIWCRLDVSPENVDKSMFLHVIDGDETDTVAILDGMVWEWIIGQNCIPDEEWDKIRFSTSHLLVPERNIRREQMKAEYARTHLPDDLWANLRTDDISCRMPQILLNWPLKASNIVDVKSW